MYRATVETTEGSWLQFSVDRTRLARAVVAGLKAAPVGDVEGVRIERVICPPGLAGVKFDADSRLPLTLNGGK